MSLPKETVEILEALAPELRESEDERIRKALIEVFKEKLERGFEWVEYGIPNRSVLSWLEKQKVEHPKEQNQNIELIQKSWYMEGYHDCKFNKEPKWIIKTGEGGPRYEENPKYGQIIEEEQKSAEWNEEDEEMLNSCISSIEEAKENRYAYKETDGDTSYDHEIAWLKTLPLSLKKKNEDVAKLCSNEWSEEDEKDVAHIIRVLDDCYAYGKHDLSKTDHDNLTSTIKSIRSCPKASDNWKPTEEQMRALWDAYKGGKEQESLRELIEQLKKL